MVEATDDAYFRHLCHHAGVALIATDARLRIRFWNAAASRIFGSTAEVMLGEPLLSVVPGERRALAERLLERALTRGETNSFEFPHRDPAGGRMFLAVCVSPIINDAGERIGVSVYIRDVTRRIETQQALADAAKMTALGTMAGAIAHHFNNLLGGLVTSADFAQTSDDPEALRRVLRTIVGTLGRASRLTVALLAFAEGEHTDSATAEAGDTIRRFVETIEPRLGQCRIRLETVLAAAGCRLPIRCLETLLDCLTSNACEAMPEGGTLRIELLKPPDRSEAVLRIADTGRGMSEEDLRHAFEPFYTTKAVDPAGAAAHPGLGLAVAHGIVRSLGGTVTLCSSPGEGTICSVQIPLKRPAPS